MKINAYIKDKIYFLLFYVILMVFVVGMVAFISVKNTYSNVLYVCFVLVFLLIIYLLIDYFRISSYFSSIDKKVDNENLDWIQNLPTPISYLTQKNNEYLLQAYKTSQENNQTLIDQHKENINFVNTWVHEIKVPVAASKLVINNSLQNPSEEALKSVYEEIEKIEKYVEQVLYYSKINDFSKDYLLAPTNMEQLIKEQIKNFKKQFISRKIAIELENINYTIDTDKKWIGYILNQLLSNALKYTNDNGKISIKIEESNNEFRLFVIDNGIGIKEDEINRVFDRGFTGTTGRVHTSSTGLGLYMAQSLAQKLGLSISVTSEVEVGSTFIIHFPKWELL